MARIRTIKPEFWTDSKTGRLDVSAKCVFIGLLNHVDDYGVMRYDATELGIKIFPYCENSRRGLDDIVRNTLENSGIVTIFCYANGPQVEEEQEYLFINNFYKHQRVDRPSQPLLPGWKKGMNIDIWRESLHNDALEQHRLDTENHSTRTLRTLDDHSTPERKGKEGKGKERKDVASDLAKANPAKPKGPLPVFQNSEAPAALLISVTHEVQNAWLESFPIDYLKQELKKVVAWVAINPRKRPKNYGPFLNNWFNRGWDAYRKTIDSNPTKPKLSWKPVNPPTN